MTGKVFAQNFQVNDKGWIVFDSDDDLRDMYSDSGYRKHPAKQNMGLILELMLYLTERGDVVLDPMSGTGTNLVGLTVGRNVINIELEEHYYQTQLATLEKIQQTGAKASGIVLHGDCRKFLPIPCDHVIFSPPYADTLSGKADNTKRHFSNQYVEDFTASENNLGRLAAFFFNIEMERVYRLLHQSLKPGGTMTVIIKDFIRSGKRIALTEAMIRQCSHLGFKVREWHKRYAASGYTALNSKRGVRVVDDEDLVIFEKV